MRYLGIDPGTTLIGYGVIEDLKGSFTCLTYGVIRNPGADSQTDKRATLEAIIDLVHQYQPDQVGIEKLFFFKNQKTVMPVSEMRGVIMLALAQCSLPVQEFTPPQVKQQICGHGKAEKKQVQKMVQMLLHIPEAIRPDDAADALALALCAAVAPKSY